MRRVQPAVVMSATMPDPGSANAAREAAAEPRHRSIPACPPIPHVAERMRDALLRWLEEDM